MKICYFLYEMIIFVLMQKEVNTGIHLCFSYLFVALMKWCGTDFLKIQAFCILHTIKLHLN
jgi:hypothetical protein